MSNYTVNVWIPCRVCGWNVYGLDRCPICGTPVNSQSETSQETAEDSTEE